MIKFSKLIFTVFVLGINLVSAVLADDKAVLEKIYQERVKEIIEKVIGIKDYVVIVEITPNEEVLRESETRKIESSPIPRQNIYSGIGSPSASSLEEYLPGISESEISTPAFPNQYHPQPSTEQMQRLIKKPLPIKKMAISVIINKDVPLSDANRIKDEIGNLTGFNSKRGDEIIIRQSFFKKSWQDKALVWLNFLTPHIYWVLGLLIAMIFLFGPLNRFFKNAVRAMEVFRIEANAQLRSQGLLEVGRFGERAGIRELTGEPQRQLLPGGNNKDNDKLFGFVNEDNLKSLIYLVCNDPPSKIALICSYLDSNLSSRIIASLPAEVQSQVMLEIATVRQSTPEEVIALEEDLKRRIEFMRGGVDHFIAILDHVDSKTQERLLYQLKETDPGLAQKVEKQIFRFEQITELGEKAIQMLTREAGIPAFAIALKGVSEAVINKITQTISKGAAEMLKQEMDLSGEIPLKRIEAARRTIVETFRRLEKDGAIKLPKQ